MNREPELLTVNGTKLFVQDLGKGFPIVLVHAGIADSGMWEDQLSFLAEATLCQHICAHFCYEINSVFLDIPINFSAKFPEKDVHDTSASCVSTRNAPATASAEPGASRMLAFLLSNASEKRIVKVGQR